MRFDVEADIVCRRKGVGKALQEHVPAFSFLPLDFVALVSDETDPNNTYLENRQEIVAASKAEPRLGFDGRWIE